VEFIRGRFFLLKNETFLLKPSQVDKGLESMFSMAGRSRAANFWDSFLRTTFSMKTFAKAPAKKGGFSLVELTIVVVILGVLAMMGVPRYQKVVERAKGAAAFTYLAQIEGAQERHNARTGTYARYLKQLDTAIPAPKHFRVHNFTSYNWETQWEMKVQRTGPSSGFGAYTVTWNQDGFQRARSSIHTDLLPVL
jgi:prepilin-type N-terminal cleavage/methylation domain-containing protein